jgi:hypothetical protein
MPIISLYRLPDGPCRLQQKPKKQPGVNGSGRHRRKRIGPFAAFGSTKVEAAYRRGDGFQKRQLLAEVWARYCAEPKTRPAVEGDRNIVALRRRRAKAA